MKKKVQEKAEERQALMWELHGEVVNQFLRLIRERPEEINGAMLGALCAFLRDNGITMKKGSPAWEVEEFLEGLKSDSPFPFAEDSQESDSSEAGEDPWSKPEEAYLPFD